MTFRDYLRVAVVAASVMPLTARPQMNPFGSAC
jgi:hypothetical protein